MPAPPRPPITAPFSACVAKPVASDRRTTRRCQFRVEQCMGSSVNGVRCFRPQSLVHHYRLKCPRSFGGYRLSGQPRNLPRLPDKPMFHRRASASNTCLRDPPYRLESRWNILCRTENFSPWASRSRKGNGVLDSKPIAPSVDSAVLPAGRPLGCRRTRRQPVRRYARGAGPRCRRLPPRGRCPERKDRLGVQV